MNDDVLHFTTTINHREKYSKFDDWHYKVVFEYNSTDLPESVIHSLMCEDFSLQ